MSKCEYCEEERLFNENGGCIKCFAAKPTPDAPDLCKACTAECDRYIDSIRATPPHEYVHNEAYPDEVYCRNCGLYPANGATRSCNEEERAKWRDIQNYLREGLQ